MSEPTASDQCFVNEHGAFVFPDGRTIFITPYVLSYGHIPYSNIYGFSHHVVRIQFAFGTTDTHHVAKEHIDAFMEYVRSRIYTAQPSETTDIGDYRQHG